ncbi:MAG: MBL fold metallo-hydrolase [Clostridiales bacterium]|nr:MBL fold metallo-hydrolase [Clostridiales bacterium]
MKLYILGCMGPYPEKDLALSGYLVQSQNAKVLIDCGSGVLAQLQKYTQIKTLDALILTHLHFDHISDVFVLKYYCMAHNFKLDVYMPQEDSMEYRLISSEPEFNIIHIEDGKNIKIKDMDINFVEMVHLKKNLGVKISDGQATLAYTGDTVLNPNLDILTEGADVVLMDCAYPSEFHLPEIPHMSLYQGAKYAQDKPFKLLVTHVKPETDIQQELDWLGLNRVYQGDVYEIIRGGYKLKDR